MNETCVCVGDFDLKGSSYYPSTVPAVDSGPFTVTHAFQAWGVITHWCLRPGHLGSGTDFVMHRGTVSEHLANATCLITERQIHEAVRNCDRRHPRIGGNRTFGAVVSRLERVRLERAKEDHHRDVEQGAMTVLLVPRLRGLTRLTFNWGRDERWSRRQRHQLAAHHQSRDKPGCVCCRSHVSV